MALAAPVAALVAQSAHAAKPDRSCEPKDLAALAGWSGVWAAEGMDAVDQGISGRSPARTDYRLLGLDAPWNENGWRRMREMGRLAGAPNFRNSGWGFPMMMNSFSELTFIIAPAQTAIVGQYREIRSIYTDGRGHLPEEDRWPTNWGDSTGCWSGDTLTIDTVSVKYDPGFNGAAPPLSDQAHFVERLRLVAPGRIESEVTITDPVTLTAPWVVHLAYVPAGIDRLVLDAFDDRYDPAGQTITSPDQARLTTVASSPDVKLSAAELDRLAGHYALDGAPAEFVFVHKGDRLYFQPPGFGGFLPMFAQDSLNFEPIGGGKTRFVTDASGKVIGFEATNPDGTPIKGTRKQP